MEGKKDIIPVRCWWFDGTHHFYQYKSGKTGFFHSLNVLRLARGRYGAWPSTNHICSSWKRRQKAHCAVTRPAREVGDERSYNSRRNPGKKMASTSLIEKESPDEEDLVKAPRKRPLRFATRQLQVLLKPKKFNDFEDLTAQATSGDASSVVASTKNKRKPLKVQSSNFNIYLSSITTWFFQSNSGRDLLRSFLQFRLRYPTWLIIQRPLNSTWFYLRWTSQFVYSVPKRFIMCTRAYSNIVLKVFLKFFF